MAIAVVALLPLSGCDKKKGGQGQQADGTTYTVRELKEQQITLPSIYPTTLRGKLDVEIRPQVAGPITQVAVDEGAKVRKGQLLFVLDQVQFQEAVNAARAAVAVAESQVATAELTAKNNRQLASENIIGDYALQSSENQLATAKASLASAKAQLASAQKQLSYTRVVSPTDGVVGSIPYRVGSLVSPQMPQPLTSVSDISEMYAHFSITERQFLALSRAHGGLKEGISSIGGIELRLIDGTIYPHKGVLETVSGVLNPTTGSLNVRVLFPNPDRILLSGATGEVIIPNVIENAIEVPQLATFQLQKNSFIYVVDNEGNVTAQGIELLPQNDGQNYIVTSGLSAGDKVVLDGAVTLREGMKIKYQMEER
ncbi:efflux RND transporter periplasmic adaptor subunit [Porphyromonas sp.]|uniref:efflux RND transporter periplasmic adaptor subunit n=1 Tax=Porphyromonas sp. TaxID=1924944 RepID=UPI002A91507F|nr:efflux RND transporter periplasmic adaptor subunit [Porphyromonas sp.]